MSARDSARLEQRESITQDAQNGISARPQGARRLKRTSFHPPTPSCRDSSITGGYVAGRRATENDARGIARSARRGWAGEKGVIFSILLEEFRFDQVQDPASRVARGRGGAVDSEIRVDRRFVG